MKGLFFHFCFLDKIIYEDQLKLFVTGENMNVFFIGRCVLELIINSYCIICMPNVVYKNIKTD